VAGVRTERKLTSKGENVSDHLDAQGLKSPNMDARADITDIFAFQNPADPMRSVLAMNVNPLAPTLADSFAPEAVYELILDTDSDAVADVTYRVTFSPRENGDQKATVRRATGEETRTAEISGEVLFRNVPVSFDGDAGVVESGDYEFFVGIRSDPFFFDLEGFQHDFEFTGEDFFIDKNVFSMVLEMPNKALGEGQIGFWCRVLGREDGDLFQIDRMGRSRWRPGPDTARRSRPAPSSGNTVPDSGRHGERLGGHRFQGACGGVSALKEHHPERSIDGD
jgi:hypothetical protein